MNLTPKANPPGRTQFRTKERGFVFENQRVALGGRLSTQNPDIELGEDSVRGKLRTYGKVGPLGSIGKRCVVDIDELSALLNEDRPRPGELWG